MFPNSARAIAGIECRVSWGDTEARTTVLGKSAAAAFAFRVAGELHVAMVVKATFQFVHQGPMVLVNPDPLVRADAYRGDNLAGSVTAVNDLIPY